MFDRSDQRPSCGWRRWVALIVWTLGFSANAERADRDKPVNIEADRVNIDDAKKVSVFEGSVVLTQGTLIIRGDRMVVREDKEGYQYGTVFGALATFRQKREGVDQYVDGQAERIEYDGRAEKLQLFNRAQMKRGDDEVRGSYISYDQPTEFFRVVGGGKEAATANNPQGRVRAVIQPKNKDKDKSGKPAADPPAPLTLKPTAGVANPRD